MSAPLRKATKTGRSIPHRDGTLHEVLCPDCTFPQFHRQGINRCIICNARWHVVVFDVIPGKLPDKKEEDP